LVPDDTSENRFVAKFVLIFVTPIAPYCRALLRPRKVHARVDWLVPRHHKGPILNVVVCIDSSEDRMVHVAVVGTAADIEKIKFHGFSIG
jgi:hypothetical protein